MFGALAKTFQRPSREAQQRCTNGIDDTQSCPTCQGEAETFTLNAVPCGRTCTISSIAQHKLSQATQRRLAELGLRAGMHVTISQKTSAGGRVLKIGTTRYAIDGATAAEMLVHVA
ncbi:FeoA family protein [Corynebacterium pseudopelargi]|uniref:FeoA domain protein n=1 Tax=Corynebacterium pseudopelargi TaxID=2080757 RepID=A0A3G6ISW3_9CORY|nr:FeoA family protein [Corynebacterium pseudopelargi]AZA08646.1 FeoA domain protein [Corynebacterium pseudopelargi]